MKEATLLANVEVNPIYSDVENDLMLKNEVINAYQINLISEIKKMLSNDYGITSSLCKTQEKEKGPESTGDIIDRSNVVIQAKLNCEINKIRNNTLKAMVEALEEIKNINIVCNDIVQVWSIVTVEYEVNDENDNEDHHVKNFFIVPVAGGGKYENILFLSTGTDLSSALMGCAGKTINKRGHFAAWKEDIFKCFDIEENDEEIHEPVREGDKIVAFLGGKKVYGKILKVI